MNRRLFIGGIFAAVSVLAFGITHPSWRRLDKELPSEGQMCDVKTVAKTWRHETSNVGWTLHKLVFPGGWIESGKGLLVADPKITFWRPA